jgi:hypothetical protein
MGEGKFILFTLVCVVLALKSELAQGRFNSPLRIIIPLGIVVAWIALWYSQGSRVSAKALEIPPKSIYPIHLMPRPSRWSRALLWMVYLLLIVGLSLVDLNRPENQTVLSICAAVGLLFFLTHRVKCSECGSRLSSYRLKESGERTRLYHDCPTCRVTWKSQSTSMVSID